MQSLIGSLISTWGGTAAETQAPSGGPLEQFLDWSVTVSSPRQWRQGCRQAWGILHSMLQGLRQGGVEQLPDYAEVLALLTGLKLHLQARPSLGCLDRDAWRRDLSRLQEIRSSWEKQAGLRPCPGCASLNHRDDESCSHCGAPLAENDCLGDLPVLPAGFESLRWLCLNQLRGRGEAAALGQELLRHHARFGEIRRTLEAIPGVDRDPRSSELRHHLAQVTMALQDLLRYHEVTPQRLREGLERLAKPLWGLIQQMAAERE